MTLLCPYLGSLTVASSSEMYVISDDVGSFAFFEFLVEMGHFLVFGGDFGPHGMVQICHFLRF